MKKLYLMETDEVIKELNSCEDGLRLEDITWRREKYGLNEIQKAKKENIVMKFIHELSNLMTIVLITAAVISGFNAVYAGESLIETGIILFVVFMNAVIGVIQKSKAEAAIESLQKMSAATCKVIRNRNLEIIKASELVPGDIIMLEAGDAVPADARILEGASLKVEEAALTGESVSVSKHNSAIKENGSNITLGDRKNMLYTGSSVVYGRGKAIVSSTGMDTEIGKIAKELNTAKEEETPLQMKLNQLSKILSCIVLAICVIVFAVDFIRLNASGTTITAKSYIDTFMVAVSLAVAAIPEGLSAVVTILLSIGVSKMARNKAIVRKLTAVETLGGTQVICSDKTGTLTQNKMTVVEHYADDDKQLMLAMALCCDAEMDTETGTAVGEPTECALVNDAYKNGLNKNNMKEKFKRVAEAPFDSMRKMMTTIHDMGDGTYVQYTKGAPDEVLKRCAKAYIGGKKDVVLTNEMKEDILRKNKDMADRALRVLCAAEKIHTSIPETDNLQELEENLTFIGLSGMIDPVREEVKLAVAECKKAGIRPIMITGDHKDTAIAIANELGILSDGMKAITGAELDIIGDDELEDTIDQYAVYARVQPEHKVRVVKTWRKLGKVTAMTGDGVNDAPAIKNADIGVGMGITGTDVTKNVADIVLADDNFATIVMSVAEGRRIYDNIQKSIQFLLSSNLAEVIAIFFSSLLGFTILKPVHLLWINLITDCLPAIGLGMEEAEADVMERVPRKKEEGLFSNGVGIETLIQGSTIAALTMIAYFIGHFMESGKLELANSPDGMTMAFLTLSLLEMFHAFNMRSRHTSLFKLKRQNKLLLASLIMSFVLTTAIIYIPVMRNAFSFEEISIVEYFVAILLAFVIIPIVEFQKWLKRHTSKNPT